MRAPRLPLPVVFGIAAVVALALLHSAEIRERSEAGLGKGMPAREAALARGFVLGEDEGIDAATEESFRRSGLSHLLAVSGQNVTLLGLLAMPLLAALRVPLRERLIWVLGGIAVYVSLTGAGPSIQRAAVMGAVGLLATLGGRRSSRWYALALAALVTLGIDPGIATDVGWQLSFAAVVGILLLAAPLRRAIAGRIGSSGLRGALAEGVGVTVAATLTTAPLIAFHFETFSTTTLAANVLAMPAVAPAMWLGMTSAAAAQVPGLPVEALNGLNALLLAYIAQVAAWFGGPDWAEAEVHLGPVGLVASYVGLGVGAVGVTAIARWRRLASARGGAPKPWRLVALGALAVVVLAASLSLGRTSVPADDPRGLRINVLDVGQGDAILFEPAGAPAVLVDGGPAGEDLAGKLAASGVESLGAAVITHDQSDHAAGVEELLGEFPVARLLYARVGRGTLAEARMAGASVGRLAAGREVRSGALRLEVLWPPPELLSGMPVGTDPNQLALVMLVRWRDFRMLLTADAEAEAVPLDPGPVDVLKVAHHGSEDAGLGALLDSSRPRLAVISVGSENSYGHPAAVTLATLAAHRTRILRTDLNGDIVIDVGRRSFAVSG
ncbi:MAG: ComEC/Rec2 family competence protein [Solirubrobacterales bacterium]